MPLDEVADRAPLLLEDILAAVGKAMDHVDRTLNGSVSDFPLAVCVSESWDRKGKIIGVGFVVARALHDPNAFLYVAG